jgi:uncharacterized membrane protein
MNNLAKLNGIILLIWATLSFILGISYRFEGLSQIISIDAHPIFTLISTPIILLINTILTKKNLKNLNDAIKIKNLQASSNLFLILGVLTYLIGLGVKVGFLPFFFHQILAIIFILLTLKISINLITLKK